MLIRKVKIEDLPRIDLIIEEAFSHTVNPFMLRQYFELFSETYLVAELDDEIVGFCIGGVNSGAAQGWILDLAVLPKNRRNGIARKLTEELCDCLRCAGMKTVSLTVDPVNDTAIALYGSCGFNSLGVQADYFGKGVDRLVMRTGL